MASADTEEIIARAIKPQCGRVGRPISLRVNHFRMTFKRAALYRYDVTIIPEECTKAINRRIIEQMVQTSKHVFGNQKPVFDGRKNMYTILPLEGIKAQKDEMELEGTMPAAGTAWPFRVTLRFISKIDLELLKAALRPDGGSRLIPSRCLQALDTIMRYFASLRYVQIGRSFFSPPRESSFDLGGGKEVWFGYHQTVLPTNWTMQLNLDASATHFYKGQPVINFLWEFLKITNPDQQKIALTDLQRIKFAKEIKGLKVQVTHCGSVKRTYRVTGVTSRPASHQLFPYKLENGVIYDRRVSDYFFDKYELTLKYAHLPCLQVGRPEKKTYLPLEVCTIVSAQKCMKKLTDTQASFMSRALPCTAPLREEEIDKLVQNSEFGHDPYAREFGVYLSKDMSQVTGRILAPPALQYRGEQAIPKGGAWDMRNKQFFAAADINVWAIVCFAPRQNCSRDTLRKFSYKLHKVANNAGMKISQEPCDTRYASGVDQVETVFRSLKKKFQTLQLAVVVLPEQNTLYPEVKRVCDVVVGLTTQCVLAKYVISPTVKEISNLCLKINPKLGGVNCILHSRIRPKVLQEPVIFLGAQVIHPFPGDKTKPSIAAVVGSMDAYPSRYVARVGIQEDHLDIIQDLNTMVKELLIEFYRFTSFKPVRIIYYHNDVSEGQVEQIWKPEVIGLREACLQLEDCYQPGITYIIVSKKHHTRMFAINVRERVGRSGNIPAGTTVDSIITHPKNFDFYLCSHTAFQGTSCPPYYQVLMDDNKFSSDEIEYLSFCLCHTYARCTRAVSLPAPAYYAQCVAIRARYHLREKGHDSVSGSQSSVSSEHRTPAVLRKAITVHPNIIKTMYFA